MFFAAVLVGALVLALGAGGPSRSIAQDKPPEGDLPGDYVGEKTCRKCHFKEWKVWKDTGHAKGFTVLPDKYKTDASCLKCHATGHGQPGGFESMEKTPEHGAVACEGCHGPGKPHADFMRENEAKKDDAEVKKKGKSLIVEQSPKCIRCHMQQSHRQHPDYEGKK